MKRNQFSTRPANRLTVCVSAWITLNNPAQYNSYTTEMVKGVIAGFHRAQEQRNVVAVVFTGAGNNAFCTGGNTKEYSEYYSQKPTEYAEYMTLFNAMVDSILMCQKPVIRRINGMSVAGGQEIGGACDIAVSADTAIFGQAGPAMVPPRSAAHRISYPGLSPSKMPCGTAFPARCGAPIRC